MCCGEFIAKYVLFFANLVFSLAGIALITLGIIVIVQIDEILELIPVNINVIPISIIVLGSIIFVITFFGCCGAIRESRCMLVMYAVCMLILAGLKTWLAVVIFDNLRGLQSTVENWLNNAFNNANLAGPFNVLEVAFRCCGTTGPEAYGTQRPLPPSCCASPVDNTCPISEAFGGCNARFASYLESFGDAIGYIVITIIIVELIAMILALFLNHRITESRKSNRY